ERLGVPVIDHWWQTETGWAIGANCVGLGMLPVKPGSPTKAVPGYDVQVLGEDGRQMPAGEIGAIVVKLTMPQGCMPTLWIKGEIPVGFVVTKAGVTRSEAEIVRELVERVREQIGPVAAFKAATVVKRLPKTRSGKILRGTMKRIAEGTPYTTPATIDDPVI